MQAPQLQQDQGQAKNPGQAGGQEILPVVP
jgi:hypothetical protein